MDIILYTYWIQIIIFWKCSVLFPSAGVSTSPRTSLEGQTLYRSKMETTERILVMAGLAFLWSSLWASVTSSSTVWWCPDLTGKCSFQWNSAFPLNGVQGVRYWNHNRRLNLSFLTLPPKFRMMIPPKLNFSFSLKPSKLVPASSPHPFPQHIFHYDIFISTYIRLSSL